MNNINNISEYSIHSDNKDNEGEYNESEDNESGNNDYGDDDDNNDEKVICKGNGECLIQENENIYVKNPDIICNNNCVPIKCKNYIICNCIFPEIYNDGEDCEGCCHNCSIMYGLLKFLDKTKCSLCLETKIGILHPNCNHSICIDCFNYGGKCIICNKKQIYTKLLEDINNIETSMYSNYLQTYKSKTELLKCPIDNKEYEVDKCKLNFLTKNIPFGLNKVKIGKSKIHGNGIFAQQNILKGELITFYPGDHVGYNPKGDNYIPGNLSMIYPSSRFEQHFGKSCIISEFPNIDYAFDINNIYRIS